MITSNTAMNAFRSRFKQWRKQMNKNMIKKKKSKTYDITITGEETTGDIIVTPEQ
jgi:hypothetical protein